MPAPTLRFKRGASATLPALRQGEPAFTTDTFDLYIGSDSTLANNKFFGSHRYWSKESTNTGGALKLFEGTSTGNNYIALKSPNSLSGNLTLVLPNNYGSPNSLLSNDGSGNLSWVLGLTLSGINTFTNTTDSHNITTGALVTYGGVGISKNLNVGGSLTVAGLSTFYNGIGVSNGIDVNGISTFNSGLNVSSGLTADTYYGDGSNLTGIKAVNIIPSELVDEIVYPIFSNNIGIASIAIDENNFAYIPSTGSLGIGTTQPAAKLEVSGSIVASSIGIGTTVFSTALYVEGDTVITGDLTVKGTTTTIDVDTLSVKDSIIDLGLVDNGSGVLVPPTSDANIDLGVIFNYFTNAAKKSGIFWDDSTGRIGIASDVTESSSLITANAYADLVIKSLWVNDCVGESQVIQCNNSTRELANITIDGGFY